MKKFAAAHSRASIDFLYTYLDERDAVDYTKDLQLKLPTANKCGTIFMFVLIVGNGITSRFSVD